MKEQEEFTKPLRLKSDVKTRWSSEFAMLVRFVRLFEVFSFLLSPFVQTIYLPFKYELISIYNKNVASTEPSIYDQEESFLFFFQNVKDVETRFLSVVGIIFILREAELISRLAEGDTYVTMAHVPFWLRTFDLRMKDKRVVDNSLQGLDKLQTGLKCFFAPIRCLY